MAHRPLTLKYRPQVFADMVGQEHVTRVLSRAIESGRVAHAYLFAGARGVGKTTTARILAKALNCERRGAAAAGGKGAASPPGADPCNACTSCVEITTGVSLDVSEIDGASNRGIADVQALREKVRFTPTGGRRRVVIIDEVHQLSNDAFAALLKTLEEPPPHLVFIFATTDPQKLPETIRSRCQRFDFARVPPRQVTARLMDVARREQADPEGSRFTLTEGAAFLIAHKSEGSIRDAVSALDQVVSSGETTIDEELVRRILGIADREVFFALADAIVRRDAKAALHALHQGFAKGLDARDLAEGLAEHLRHLLILRVDPEGADLVAASAEDLKRLRAQGEGWSEGDLLRLLRIVTDVLTPMRDSPQPLIHLEAAVMQMATLEAGETLSEILERLQELEQRLGGEPGASPPRRSTPGSGARSSWAAPVSTGSASATAVPPQPSPREATVAPQPAPREGAGSQPAMRKPESAEVHRAAGAVPSATAVADEPLELDERVEQCWRQAIAGTNARKRLLGAFVEESRFLGRTPAGLVLATDDLHRAVIEEKENRALLADEVRRAFGEALPVVCVPLAGPPLAEKPSIQSTREMVQRAVAWFEGESIAPAQRGAERNRG